MSSLQQAHVQRFYRPLIIGFVTIALAVIGGVVYASAGTTTIEVTPALTSVTSAFTLTVSPTPTGDLAIPGTVISEPLTATVTATPGDGGAEVPAHATGAVTIKNTSGADQPLAAGTRLQHENGIIVRTTARLDVPAHNEVTATVVADPLGESGNLSPSKFTIVALRAGNQSLIYGISTTALTGGLVRQAGSLSLDALTKASNSGEQKIRADFGESSPGIVKALVPVSVATVPPAEEAVASYDVTVTMKGLVVTFDQAALATIVSKRLSATLKDQQELASTEPPTITVDSQPTADSVTLKVAVEGLAQLRADSSLLAPTQFVGLTKSDIVTKLLGSSLVKNVEVTIAPRWRTTAADTVQKITVRRVTP